MKKILVLLLATLICLPCLPYAGQAMGAIPTTTVRASEKELIPLKRKKNKKKRRSHASAYQRSQSGKLHFRR